MSDSVTPPNEVEGRPASGLPIATEDDLIRKFVEHWGVMARAWGINATMGELFALMFVTGTDWTADDLRERLRVSRGNVSMNLRELMAWGVIHKVHRTGERREYFRAETEVWTLFRRILTERKKRELDPTLALLETAVDMIPVTGEHSPRRERIAALRRFFGLIDTIAGRMLSLDVTELKELQEFFEPTEPQPQATSKEP